eukprot:m.54722 g.54722  ORF g.54722 m.54722 type:complete len:761 (+) comp11443_c1_seq1:27-2309(+)
MSGEGVRELVALPEHPNYSDNGNASTESDQRSRTQDRTRHAEADASSLSNMQPLELDLSLHAPSALDADLTGDNDGEVQNPFDGVELDLDVGIGVDMDIHMDMHSITSMDDIGADIDHHLEDDSDLDMNSSDSEEGEFADDIAALRSTIEHARVQQEQQHAEETERMRTATKESHTASQQEPQSGQLIVPPIAQPADLPRACDSVLKQLKLGSSPLTSALSCNLVYQEIIKRQLAALEHTKQRLLREKEVLSGTSSSKDVALRIKPHPLFKPWSNRDRSTFFTSHKGRPMPPSPLEAQAMQERKEVLQLYTEDTWSVAQVKELQNAILCTGQTFLKSRLYMEERFRFFAEKTSKQFTAEEQALVSELREMQKLYERLKLKEVCLRVDEHKDLSWTQVASMVTGKSESECRSKWLYELSPTINRSAWKKAEDTALLKIVNEHPNKDWDFYAHQLKTHRTARDCFNRYQRSLNQKMQRRRWTKEEDEALTRAVNRYGDKQWLAVSRDMPGRDSNQCLTRWRKSIDPSIRRAPWTPMEDEMLRLGVQTYGKKWTLVQLLVSGRTDMQCRERYCNVLETVESRPWSQKEDEQLDVLARQHSCSWTRVAAELTKAGFPRTDNMCLRRWEILRPQEFLERQKQKRKHRAVIMSNYSGGKARKQAKPEWLEDTAANLGEIGLTGDTVASPSSREQRLQERVEAAATSVFGPAALAQAQSQQDATTSGASAPRPARPLIRPSTRHRKRKHHRAVEEAAHQTRPPTTES